MITHATPKNTWGEVILITGYFYRVDFGPGVNNRLHFVYKGVCSCSAGENCKAVTLVQNYLNTGGSPAPNPPDGFYAVVPHRCPVCGSLVKPDPRRTSPVRGAGWSCQAHKGHYWQSLGRKKQAACHCFVYPFAHEPGSGICLCGKEKQPYPCDAGALVAVPA